MDTTFLAAIALFAIAAISPGPAVLAILITGMSEGRPRALALACGIISGSFFWSLIALFGFTQLLENLGSALVVLKIFGAVYLAWLAWKAFSNAKSSIEPKPAKLNGDNRLHQLYLSGLLLHLTNPKAVFSWVATITVGITQPENFSQAATLVAACMVVVIVVNFTMAVGFSSPSAIAFYSRGRRWIQGSAAAFFASASVFLVASAVRK